MAVSDENERARKWPFRDAPRPQPTDESDAFVEMWKRAWLSGADAAWATNPTNNPQATLPGSLGQAVLATPALDVLPDLLGLGLPNVDVSGT